MSIFTLYDSVNLNDYTWSTYMKYFTIIILKLVIILMIDMIELSHCKKIKQFKIEDQMLFVVFVLFFVGCQLY